MKQAVLTAYLICVISIGLQAQKLNVQNLKIGTDGMVSFTCLVEAHHSDREEYELKVFSSADDFQNPLPLKLQKLKPGVSQPFSFDGNKTIGNFDGTITFDFQLSATVFPVQITSIDKKFKKGKEITISWEDFHQSGWYDVEIYHDDALFQRVVGNHRGTSYTTTLPEKMDKGAYEVRVIPSNQKELVSEDYLVEIKSAKTGIIVGAGGALVGVGVLLLGNGSDGALPVPPDLPEN